MAVIGVPADVGGLVGAPKAGVIGGDAAKAGVTDRRDHLPPQERPGRLTVEEDDRLPLPLIEVGQAEPVNLTVVRIELEAGQALESLLGSTHRIDRHRARVYS